MKYTQTLAGSYFNRESRLLFKVEQPDSKPDAQLEEKSDADEFAEILDNSIKAADKFVDVISDSLGKISTDLSPKLKSAFERSVDQPQLAVDSERMVMALKQLPDNFVSLVRDAIAKLKDSTALQSSVAVLNAELAKEGDPGKKTSIASLLEKYFNANSSESKITASSDGVSLNGPSLKSATESSESEVSDYVGMTVEDAKAKAVKEGKIFRIIAADGERFIVTRDFVAGRLNASVENGKVVSIGVEGDFLKKPNPEKKPEKSDKWAALRKIAEIIVAIFRNKNTAQQSVLPNATLGNKLNLPAGNFDIKEQQERIARLNSMIKAPDFRTTTPKTEQVQMERQLQVEQKTLQEQQRLIDQQWEYLNYVERGMPQYLASCGLGHIQTVVNRSKGRIEFRGMRGAADSEMLKNMVYNKMPGRVPGIYPTGSSRQPYATMTINQVAVEGLTRVLGTAGMSDSQLMQRKVSELGLKPGDSVENIVMNMPEGDERFGVPVSVRKSREYASSLPEPMLIPASDKSIMISFSYGIADKNPALKNIPGNKGINNSGILLKNLEGNSKYTENLQKLPFNERWKTSRIDQPLYKKAALKQAGVELVDVYQDAGNGKKVRVATEVRFTQPIDQGEWVQINGKKYYGSRGSSTSRRFA